MSKELSVRLLRRRYYCEDGFKLPEPANMRSKSAKPRLKTLAMLTHISQDTEDY